MPILQKISLVEMRKEHFEMIFALLDIKNNKDDIFFQLFVDNNIQDQTVKVLEICKLSLDQMLLRKDVQLYIQKYNNIKLETVEGQLNGLQEHHELFITDQKYLVETLTQNPQFEIVQDQIEGLKKSLNEFTDIANKMHLLLVE
jgi:hypothetical protein